jgi:hypothetical protein
VVPSVTPSSEPYTLITTQVQLQAVIPLLLAAPRLGFDVETTKADDDDHPKRPTALNPRRGRLRLLQFATEDHTYVIDHFQVLDLTPLEPVFDGQRTIIGHNLAFDFEFCAAAGLPVPPGSAVFDTFLGAQLLDSGLHHPEHEAWFFKLDAVVDRFLHQPFSKAEQTSDWSGVLTPDQIVYAVLDAAILIPLAEAIARRLTKAQLVGAMEIESYVLPGMVWLEQSGVGFALDRWLPLSDTALAEQQSIEGALRELITTEYPTEVDDLIPPPKRNQDGSPSKQKPPASIWRTTSEKIRAFLATHRGRDLRCGVCPACRSGHRSPPSLVLPNWGADGSDVVLQTGSPAGPEAVGLPKLFHRGSRTRAGQRGPAVDRTLRGRGYHGGSSDDSGDYPRR